MIGPIQIEAKIHFNVGGNIGFVNFGFPVGEPVTESDLLVAIGKAITEIREQFDQVELMHPEAFFNQVLVKEKTGRVGKFELPDSFDYDTLKLECDALQALDEAKG